MSLALGYLILLRRGLRHHFTRLVTGCGLPLLHSCTCLCDFPAICKSDSSSIELLGQRVSEILLSLLSRGEIRDTHDSPGFSHQASRLHGKYLTNRVISPDLTIASFVDNSTWGCLNGVVQVGGGEGLVGEMHRKDE